MSVKAAGQSRSEAGETMIPSLDAQVAGTWRENPERVAWTVILACFVVFLFLAVTIPLSIQYAVRYTTLSDKAQLKATLGTLLLYQSSSTQEAIPITSATDNTSKDPVKIEEGNVILAPEGSTQGILGLINAEGNGEEALGSVQIYANTRLEVLQIRRPLFKRSPEPYQVSLRLVKGEASIFTNTGDQRPLRVEVETPHGVIHLVKAGNYRIAVDNKQTDIIVHFGRAQLAQDDKNLIVDAGLRAWMTAEQITQATSAEQSLIQNGNFTGQASDAWTSNVVADKVTPGSVKFVARAGRSVAYFIRQGEDNVHSEVSIEQLLNKNMNVYDSLILQMDVNILFQSLPGAGYLSTEFPLRVEINYTDKYGKDLHWGWGFYYRDPETAGWPIIDGTKIQNQAQWYHYESPNLIEVLRARGTPITRINSIRVYASGWNYQSMVSAVDLIAK